MMDDFDVEINDQVRSLDRKLYGVVVRIEHDISVYAPDETRITVRTDEGVDVPISPSLLVLISRNKSGNVEKIDVEL
jgi:hypothetical protein